MSVVRELNLEQQAVIATGLRKYLSDRPDSKIAVEILELLAVDFPAVFIAEIEGDADLIRKGMGDLVDVVPLFEGATDL